MTTKRTTTTEIDVLAENVEKLHKQVAEIEGSSAPYAAELWYRVQALATLLVADALVTMLRRGK